MALVAAAVTLAIPAGASAVTGELSFGDCLTSNTNVTGCAPISGASANGDDTGLQDLHAVTVTADGANVYTAASGGAAVASFSRDAASGALSYQSCVSANQAITTCTLTPDADTNAGGTGLSGVRAVAVSADGRSVYSASEFGDAVARFDRDPATGALTYAGCISSDSGVDGCTSIPGAVAGGANTGLNDLRSIAVSADGFSVYATSYASDALARFDRDPATGALTYRNCISSNSSVTGCTPIPGAVAGGNNTPLQSLYSVAVSPDGASVFVAAYDGYGVARFDRAPDGALTYRDCLSSDMTTTGCTLVPGATADGDDSALANADSVAVSADGRNVYVAAEDSDALTRFDRDPATGALEYQGCFTSNTDVAACAQVPGSGPDGDQTPLKFLESVATSADGNNVYTASLDGSLTRFDRDPISGALSFGACLTSDTDVTACTPLPSAVAGGANTPLMDQFAVTVSADGRNVYTAAGVPDAVARFARELPSNEFSFGKVKRNKRKGTAKLTVELPGRGELTLDGKRLKDAEKQPTAAGDVRLLVKPKGKLARKLRKRGAAKAKAKVTYEPTGGVENTKSKKVKLIRRR